MPISTISELTPQIKELVSSGKCGKNISHGWPGYEWAFHYQLFAERHKNV
jgi:hypothetical protein